jgi:pimeloyl-ACP methyl ester carboxylesterase
VTEQAGFLDRGDGERVAWRRVEGVGPTVVWLGGFMSDMAGTKAQALADWALGSGRAFLRFDYLGHGESSGAFRDGTISRWREDALAALEALTDGPLVLVGSSMGGWIGLLLARARPNRVAGFIGLAPAPDFTEKLMWPAFDAAQRATILDRGVLHLPSQYGEPTPITRALIEDGRHHTLLDAPIPLTCPVRILQGMEDPDVPWSHALKLVEALQSRDVRLHLIKDGDHRLSRPEDLLLLGETLEALLQPD